jgi:uncharacterized protein YdeI (YjbR/CyaY-like superfamily)
MMADSNVSAVEDTEGTEDTGFTHGGTEVTGTRRTDLWRRSGAPHGRGAGEPEGRTSPSAPCRLRFLRFSVFDTVSSLISVPSTPALQCPAVRRGTAPRSSTPAHLPFQMGSNPEEAEPARVRYRAAGAYESSRGRCSHGRKDPRVDAYIDNSAAFARPILKHLRKVVHAACPDVEETMKWSFPHFDYKGMMCSMASFKAHCAFGFWKASLVLGDNAADGAMGHMGRITALDDLPSEKVLAGYIRRAAALNDQGVKVERTPRRRADVETPEDLTKALRKNKKALQAFESFPPSHRREYVEWIVEAKGDETRRRRLETAVQWLAEGKPRNWKYAR